MEVGPVREAGERIVVGEAPQLALWFLALTLIGTSESASLRRVAVTIFASNVSRIRAVADAARASGRKLVVGNFANLLLGLVAPGARRLMCDISPCGGGRCFFAVGAGGEVSLAVKDDKFEGTAASVVVLDRAGKVISTQTTCVGEKS